MLSLKVIRNSDSEVNNLIESAIQFAEKLGINVLSDFNLYLGMEKAKMNFASAFALPFAFVFWLLLWLFQFDLFKQFDFCFYFCFLILVFTLTFAI